MVKATAARRKRPALWIEVTRSGRRRKLRVGWSAREAGLLADDPAIPSRTVEHWAATGLVVPTVRPAEAYPAWYRHRADRDPSDLCYGLGDVVALRLARDLLGRGWDRDVAEAVAADAAGWGPDEWRDWRAIATGDVVYAVPLDARGLADCDERRTPWGWPESGVAAPDGDWPEVRRDGGEPMALYPVSAVVAGIVGRVEEWRLAGGIGESQLAGWL